MSKCDLDLREHLAFLSSGTIAARALEPPGHREHRKRRVKIRLDGSAVAGVEENGLFGQLFAGMVTTLEPWLSPRQPVLERQINMAQVTIMGSVGRAGRNAPADVEKVQQLLARLPSLARLAVTRQCDQATLAAIHRFQATFMQAPDDRIDPGGRTLSRLKLIAEGLPSRASHRVPMYSQPTIELCWEACGRMMWHWRRGSLNGYQQAAGRYLQINGGLPEPQVDAFCRQLGMQSLSPATGTDLLGLLARGPVYYVGGDEQGKHAMVAVGYDLASANYSINNPCSVMSVSFASNASDSCQAGSTNLSFVRVESRLGRFLWHW